MMHGRGKSDPVIVAVKPANKAEPSAAESVEPRPGTKGNVEQQSTRQAQDWVKCVTGVGPHTASSPSNTRGKSRMRQGACTDPCGGRGVTRVPTATRLGISLTRSILSVLFDKAKSAAVPPGHCDRFVKKSRSEHDGEVGTAMETHSNFVFVNSDVGWHVDQVAEYLARLSVVVTPHTVGHQTIEATGKHEERHVEVHLEAD